ncbi:YqiA/YcfP family alpha/beta fold hydrolase [Aquimarina longa]|uniref:YqiA/YcfP family alpha/beta fold hydrolase n=1 Tax=Aquimarina longa TaxID=1080221 RepID=UPI00078674F0|nr:alpha/beta hydrolase fold domain-containing protein [Aquimarina longa]
MKRSLTYFLTLFVIKLKGIKRDFSKNPIDYKKLRKEDIHSPNSRFCNSKLVSQFKISETLITEVKSKNISDRLLIFIHGGAFVSGPGKHHWDTIKEIAKQTDITIWMCDYPKAPENRITKISNNIDSVYNSAIKTYNPSKIIIIGDSVGGTLSIALTQRLIKKNIELPNKIILVTPVMDATISNPEIDRIDKIDPMLSKNGVLSAKKMCAEDNDLEDPNISPINGEFDNFPKTILFLAENDIMYPDQKLVLQKLDKTKVDFEIILGKGMPHIWPFLPIMKESKLALKEIINRL